MPKHSRNLSSDTSRRRESDSPYPFPTESADETFSSVDFDEPPTEATDDPSPPSPAQPGRSPQDSPLPLARLTVDPPDAEPRTCEIAGSRFLIGRTDADLVVDDPFLSTWHAQLFVDGETLVLEDLNSYNGVYLRIADDLVLEDRDELVMGQQRFMFRAQWDEPSSADLPDRNVPRLGAPIAGSPVRLFHMLAGERIASVYTIGAGLTIGGEGCDVACPEDLSISTTHAEIVPDGDAFVLRDLESDYGTFIRIHDAVEVVDGDCFVVGRTRLEVTYL